MPHTCGDQRQRRSACGKVRETARGPGGSTSWAWTPSLAADPLFISPAGPDGQLGYTGGIDYGQDDNFHACRLRRRRPSPFDLERVPNGSRINIGADGNTPQANLSPAQFAQIAPVGLRSQSASKSRSTGVRSA